MSARRKHLPVPSIWGECVPPRLVGKWGLLGMHSVVTYMRLIHTAHHGRTHRSAPNANRLRAKHGKGKKGTQKIVNMHNLCLPKLYHITMANVFLVFSFLLFCPALVQNVPVVLEPDAQTMFSESCLGAIDARMGCPRQSQQLNGLSTLPI